MLRFPGFISQNWIASGISSRLAPKIEKIVVNCGIGDSSQNAKSLEVATNCLAMITGQMPGKRKAQKFVAGYKIKDDLPLAIGVTLRGNRMYSFWDRLLNLVLPEIIEFEGVNLKSFDKHGNCRIRIPDMSVFPEIIKPEMVGNTTAVDVCITTTAKRKKEALMLLALMGMPIRKKSDSSTVDKIDGR